MRCGRYEQRREREREGRERRYMEVPKEGKEKKNKKKVMRLAEFTYSADNLIVRKHLASNTWHDE